jgi:tRNA(fMet)-specific endonuclease VapC
MTYHMLDSDSIIDYLKGIQPTIATIDSLPPQGHILCFCDVVLAEVYAGLAPHERQLAERLLETFEFLPTTPAAARQAGAWRYLYARRGVALATTDVLIAAVAVERGATIVTGNVKDYPMPDVTLLPLPRPPRR